MRLKAIAYFVADNWFPILLGIIIGILASGFFSSYVVPFIYRLISATIAALN